MQSPESKISPVPEFCTPGRQNGSNKYPRWTPGPIAKTDQRVRTAAKASVARRIISMQPRLSCCVSGRPAGGPGPLEVETTEVARNVHDLSDQKQAGHLARLHSLRRESRRVHSSRGDLGFF